MKSRVLHHEAHRMVMPTKSPYPNTPTIHVPALLIPHLACLCFSGLLQLSCPGITSDAGDGRYQLSDGTVSG